MTAKQTKIKSKPQEDHLKSKKGKNMKNDKLENDDHLEPEFAETPEKNKRVHQKLDQV